MDRDFAPIPKDSRVTLRQKSLLGQIYIEITPGSEASGELEDGGRLPPANVQETVDFDELISTFDKPTRKNYQGWIKELAKAIKNGRGEDLSDAFYNFVAFTEDGNSVLEILDEQDPALRRLIKNTGVTLGAINRRYGEFGELVTNANDFFGALASRNDALAETIQVFPTFLEESRLTFVRLKTFAEDTRPLVRELQPVALQLRPTLRDLGTLAPDLEHLFRSLEPVIDESGATLPEAEKFLRCLNGSKPCDKDPQGNDQPGVLEALYPYLEELNPVLAYLNYYQAQVGRVLHERRRLAVRLAAASERRRGPAPLPPPVRHHEQRAASASRPRIRPGSAATPTRRRTSTTASVRWARSRRSAARTPARPETARSQSRSRARRTPSRRRASSSRRSSGAASSTRT